MISWTEHRRAVKLKAKQALFGAMGKGIVITLLSILLGSAALAFFPVSVPDTLPQNASNYEILRAFLPRELNAQFWELVGVSMLLYLLLTAPFTVGMQRFFLRVWRGEKPKLRTVFRPFISLRMVLGSCWLSILVTVCKIGITVALLAGPMALLAFWDTLGPLALVFGAPLYFLAALCAAVLVLPLSFAYFLYAEDPTRGALHCVCKAYTRSRGARIELAVFQLSFIPWRILAILVYPFGKIVLNPYLQVATAGFFDTVDTCK